MNSNKVELVQKLLPSTAEDLFVAAVEAAAAFGRWPLAGCQGRSLQDVLERAVALLEDGRGRPVVHLFQQLTTGVFREAYRLSEPADERPGFSWSGGSFWDDPNQGGDLIPDAVTVRDALMTLLEAFGYDGPELPLAWDTSGIRPRPVADVTEAVQTLQAARRERERQRQNQAREFWA